MSEDHIRIEEEGAPNLLEDGEQSEPAEQPGLALGGWTPEEASRLMASLYTTGILIAFAGRKARLPSIEEWPLLAGQPAEFPGTGQALVPVLDRWLPKGAGGGLAALGVGLMSVAGEVGIATGRRAHLLRKEDGRPQRPGAAPGPAPTPAGPAATEPAEDLGAGVFHFDDAQQDLLRRTPTHESYADMGMGSAA